jgi:hypothetical protein
MVTLTIPYTTVPVISTLPGIAPRRRRAPNLIVRAGAQSYVRTLGWPAIIENHYVPVNEDVARAMADAFDALPDIDAMNPLVQRAYTALIAEIQAQFTYATAKMGFCCDAWERSGQPYRQEMMDDLRDNDHLFIFTGGEPHPLLNDIDRESGFTANEQLRFIHDLFGHSAEGYGFGPIGEENAWITHSQMFSADAQQALTTETRGQSAWVNFGRHNYDAYGRHRHIPLADRPYATQKGALLPAMFCDWRSAWSSSCPMT